MPVPIPPTNIPYLDPQTGAVTEPWRRYLLDLQNSIPPDVPPVDAQYWVSTANATLTGERNIGALSTGYVKITTVLGQATPSTTTTIPADDLTPGGTFPAIDGSNLTNLNLSGTQLPVGSIYGNAAVATNPAILLGYGTWTSFGKGRVLVGLDPLEPAFDTLGETGGSQTVTLTTAQIPAHTHVQDAHTHTQNAHTHTVTDAGHVHAQSIFNNNVAGAVGVQGSDQANNASDGNTASTTTGVTIDAATAVNQNTTATNQSTGGGGAHSNLQPYVVVYWWLRTA